MKSPFRTGRWESKSVTGWEKNRDEKQYDGKGGWGEFRPSARHFALHVYVACCGKGMAATIPIDAAAASLDLEYLRLPLARYACDREAL